MLPKSPTYRTKYQNSTHRLATNERRTDAQRHDERDKRTAKPLDWRMLQSLISLNTDRRLERSRIGRGKVDVPSNFRKDS